MARQFNITAGGVSGYVTTEQLCDGPHAGTWDAHLVLNGARVHSTALCASEAQAIETLEAVVCALATALKPHALKARRTATAKARREDRQATGRARATAEASPHFDPDTLCRFPTCMEPSLRDGRCKTHTPEEG